VGQETLDRMVHAVPDHSTLLGIDEDTALIRWNPPKELGTPTEWQVMGSQTVSIFGGKGQRAVYRSGETVALSAD
jgi:hypothetical protein